MLAIVLQANGTEVAQMVAYNGNVLLKSFVHVIIFVVTCPKP